MYIYYDSKGVLKEIINDKALRQGNSGYNKIYFFIEGAEPAVVDEPGVGPVYQALVFDNGVRTFIDVEGNDLTTEAFSVTTVIKQIPFDKKRELKFFNYWTNYRMFEISVPDNILNNSGTVGCRIQMVLDEGDVINTALDGDDTLITLGLILFNVEITTGGKAIIEPDTAINIAQWNYLIENAFIPGSQALKDEIAEVLAENTDDALSLSSENPVQNKVVTTALNTKADVTYVDNQLALKENLSNKVSSWQITPTDIAYPTEKLVWDTFQTQKEEINGKSRSLVLSYLKTAPTTDAAAQALKKPDGTAFDDLADFNDYVSGYTLGNGGFDTSSNVIIWFDFQSYYLIDVEGIVYLKDDLITQFKTGDNVYITELQSSSVTNLPDRWMRISGGQISFYQLETAKVDLTSYVDLSSAQTITGTKTFNNKIILSNGTSNLEITNNGWTSQIKQGGGITVVFGGSTFNPGTTETYDLGSQYYKWQNLHLSGAVKIGTAEYTVDTWNNPRVMSNTGNFDTNANFRPTSSNNVSLGTSSLKWKEGWISTLKGVTTMTQAQYDAITPDADTLYFIEEE